MFKQLIELVNEGNLENLKNKFDKASIKAHHDEIISNFMKLHSRLDPETGEPKRIAWEVDDSERSHIKSFTDLINALHKNSSADLVSEVLGYFEPTSSKYRYLIFVLFFNFPPTTIDYFLSNFIHLDQMDKRWIEYLATFLIMTNQVEKLKILAEKAKIPEAALFYALDHKNFECVSVLLDFGMSPNIVRMRSGRLESPLSISVENQDLQTIKLLREKGAVNEIKKSGFPYGIVNALIIAAQNPNLEIVEALISSDSDVIIVIRSAIQAGNIEILKPLLNKYKDDTKQMVLIICAVVSQGSAEMIDYLLTVFDPNILANYDVHRKKDSDGSLLSMLFQSKQLTNHEKYELAKKFIQMRADINAAIGSFEDYFTYRIVHICAEFGDANLLKLLKEKGVDLNSTDSLGRNALYYAFFGRNVSTAKYLLSQGVKPTFGNSTETLLTIPLSPFADIYHNKTSVNEIISLAISLGVDVNAVPQTNYLGENNLSDHSTALHAVIINYSDETEYLVRTLLEAGAGPNVKLKNESVAFRVGKKIEFTPLDILLSPKCDRLYGGNQHNNIKRMHIAGLLFDHGAKLTESSLHMYNAQRGREGTLRDRSIWPDAETYFEALSAQSEKNYKQALKLLNQCDNYDFICCRKAKIHQLTGNYELAYQDLMVVLRKEHSNATNSGISIANELVDLFSSWNKAIDGGQQTVNNSFYDLFEVIQSLPIDALTANNHWKLAEIYIQVDGFSFSERQDRLNLHLSRITHGPYKDGAFQFFNNLRMPENQFKYKLDKILINDNINFETKKDFILNVFKNVDENLKKVGFQFLLNHDITKKEKLSDVVKTIRRAAVSNLMKDADTLLLEKQNPGLALQRLEEAKKLPLYSQLKSSYFFKNKTKAVKKIEEKIEKIKSENKLNK